MTWIYNRTRRSTLSAVLFHFLINFVGELYDLTARAELFYILLWVAMALVVIVVERPAMLAFQPEDSQTDTPM